ncbi:B3 domain-containing protein [Rhynchospora pubera]|uniref:B3 domain-containing protein n=1 Tax=Rhynchospora pubera TaxID=906938 RepID=A0AAV8F729_9POAL|nr:B3 domain-containing protein [Rhynchospora pubera]
MQFYKHMGGFFMHSISLPKKLTKQFAHLAGKVLELKRPSGGTWYVGLIMSGNKLVLQPGWNDFARANNISQNDHLVFKFIGGSKFEVFIFDPTGCEMGSNVEKEEQEQNGSLGSTVGEELSEELHNFGMIEKYEWVEIEGVVETTPQNKEKLSSKGEQGAEASNDSVPIEELGKNLYPKEESHKIQCESNIQRFNQMATECPSEKLDEKEEVNIETSSDCDLVPIGKLFLIHSEKPKHHSEIQCKTKNPPMKRLRQNPCSQPSKKGQKRSSSQSCYNDYTSKSGVQLTAEQKNKAKQLACKVQASNPYFQIFLKKHNVTPYYRMYFPAKFSAAHLQKENLEVILCCPDQGKSWFVTSYFNRARNEQILMGSTFQKFLKENNLHEGDLCVFELLKTAKRLTFAVHISRATSILDS